MCDDVDDGLAKEVGHSCVQAIIHKGRQSSTVSDFLCVVRVTT